MPGRTGAWRCATQPINYRCTFFMCHVLLISELHPLCTVYTTIAPRVLHFSAVHFNQQWAPIAFNLPISFAIWDLTWVLILGMEWGFPICFTTRNRIGICPLVCRLVFAHNFYSSEWNGNLSMSFATRNEKWICPWTIWPWSSFNLVPRPPRFYVASVEKNLCDKIWEED